MKYSSGHWLTRQILPIVRPSSPLLSSSPLLVSRNLRQSHRRSRSFSDLTSKSYGLFSDPAFRDSAFSHHSNYSDRSVDQPWRSHDAWKALHQSPDSTPGYTSSPLTHPSALPDGSGGWRGTMGKGFFAGNKTPRQRSKTLEGESPDLALESQDEWDANTIELVYKSRSGSHDSTDSAGHTESSILPQVVSGRWNESFAKAPVQIASHPLEPWKTHGREESLLPPLLPTTRQKLPERVSSFASLRDRSLNMPTFAPHRPTQGRHDSRGPQLPRASSASMIKTTVRDTAGERLMTTPIPWDRRTVSPRRSASPTLPNATEPRTQGFARLPVYSPPVDRTHEEMTDRHLVVVQAEDESEGDMSSESTESADSDESPPKERLTTPVTPPGRIGSRRDMAVRKAEAREAREVGSWNATQTGRTRGGWI